MTSPVCTEAHRQASPGLSGLLLHIDFLSFSLPHCLINYRIAAAMWSLVHLMGRHTLPGIQGTFCPPPLQVSPHSFHHPWSHRIQIGPNWDLSEALNNLYRLNNRYRLPAPPASSAPGHFGVLLIKMHLLAFVVVAIKWIIRPKTKKNLFS